MTSVKAAFRTLSALAAGAGATAIPLLNVGVHVAAMPQSPTATRKGVRMCHLPKGLKVLAPAAELAIGTVRREYQGSHPQSGAFKINAWRAIVRL